MPFPFFRRGPKVLDGAMGDLSRMFFDLPDDLVPGGEALERSALDYSVASLSRVDDYLETLMGRALSDAERTKVVLRAGAYVGEVIRRNASAPGYHWLEYDGAVAIDGRIAGFGGKSLGLAAVLWDCKQGFTFPMTKVMKFLDNGREDSTEFYARVTLAQGRVAPLPEVHDTTQRSAPTSPVSTETRQAKATVDLRGRRIILGRLDTTIHGIPTGPIDVETFDVGVDDAELGAALLGAIARARSDVPPFTAAQGQAIMAAIYRAAGVSSWNSFVRGCRSVKVLENDGALEFLPLVNLGPLEGFGAAESSIFLRERDAKSVGAALRAALNAATPR